MSMFNKVTKTQWGAHRRHGNRRDRPPGLRRRAGGHGRHRGAGHRGRKVKRSRAGLLPLTVDYIEKTYAAGKIPAASSSAKAAQRLEP